MGGLGERTSEIMNLTAKLDWLGIPPLGLPNQCGWVGGAVEDNSEKTSDMLHQNDETPLHDCVRPSEKSQLMVQ